MKIKTQTQTRLGIFETNSSSTHSFTINYDANNKKVNDAFEITLGAGEYGWEWRRITDWLSKADYAYILLYSQYRYEDNVEDDISELQNRFTKIIHQKFPEVEINFVDIGYIDHASDHFDPELNDDKALFNFIFGTGVLYTGNDNEDSPSWWDE